MARRLLAVVQNSDAARLMGINVRLAVAASFMISTALAGLAGILIAPLFNVHSDMGTLFGIKAFAVAILGGITSAWGVMLAGLAYGLIEAMVTAFFGSVYTQIVAFSFVILALDRLAQWLLRARRGEQGMTMRPDTSESPCRLRSSVLTAAAGAYAALADGYAPLHPGAGRADRRWSASASTSWSA